MIESHSLTMEITQLGAHCLLHPDGIKLHRLNQRLSGDFYSTWKPCQRPLHCTHLSPSNFISQGTSCDHVSTLLRDAPLRPKSLLKGSGYRQKHMETIEISFFPSHFRTSRAWSLKWHANAPENGWHGNKYFKKTWTRTNEPELHG